jgi:RecB family exonuclease
VPIQASGEALSYTALSELERCGYRYYLERVLGLGEDRSAARGGDSRGGLEARARGTLVHLLMETIDFARPVAPTDERIAQAAGELGLRAGETDRAELAALIGAACREALAGRIADATSVRREYPFAFSLGPREPLITGFIDLLAKERDGTQLVLDYKSDHVGIGADLPGLVEREYSIQRLLYALAVLRGGAERVEIVHWFLERPSEPVSARFEAAETDVLEGMLRGRTDFLAKRPFQVSSNPHRGLCLSCPGRAGLCSWGEAETLREDPEELQPGSREPGPAANAGDSPDQGAQLGLF